MNIRLTMLVFQMVFLVLQIYHFVIGNNMAAAFFGGLVVLMMVGVLLSSQIEESKEK